MKKNKALVLALSLLMNTLVANPAVFGQIPNWSKPFRQEGPPPRTVAPDPAKPEPVKPDVVKPDVVKPEPVKPEPVKPEPPRPADVRQQGGKSRVLVCPYYPAPGRKSEPSSGRKGRASSDPALARTFCLPLEKADELGGHTLVFVARVEDGTNRLLRHALLYKENLRSLNFLAEPRELEPPNQKVLEGVSLDMENESVRAGSPGPSLPVSGLGSMIPMADVAMAAVFTIIADMAVHRAQNLALELARDHVMGACRRLREHGMLEHLCAKFKSEPLLDLMKDRKVLRKAVVADALDYVARLQETAVPLALRPTVQFAVGLLRELVSSGRKPQAEDLRGLWEALRQSLALFGEDSALGTVLWVSTHLMLTAMETGQGIDVLEWSVFRDFKPPATDDPKYLPDYRRAMTWADQLMEEKWPVECTVKEERECRARRQARVDQLNFSLRDFVARHPQWILERTVYDTLDPEVRWSRFQEPEARKLYNRFRRLLQEKDPEAQFKSVLSILFDVLVRHKQDQLDALSSKDEPVADPSALLDGMSRSLKVIERIEKRIGRSLLSLKQQQAMTCGGEERTACRQLHRARRLLLQVWSADPEKPTILQEYQTSVSSALEELSHHLKQPAGGGRTRRFVAEVVEGHAGFLVEKEAELEKLGRELGLDRTVFAGKPELMGLIREFRSLLEPKPDAQTARLRLELTRLEVLRRLLQAVLDQDHAEILRSFIDLLQTAEANLSPGLRKGIATLRLIIGLLEPDGPGEKPQDAQKRRVQLLQEFADQMSNRKGRTREWITSVGVSAFSGGGLDWNDALGTRGQFQPVSLPIGISMQWFSPSGHGVHAMVYPLDIAQYARTDTTDEEVAVPKPSFYTALTFGVQLAYARLVRDIPFTMGIDLRYIPYIGYEEKVQQEDGTEELVSKTRRHLQILWFVGFHFPLLDFN